MGEYKPKFNPSKCAKCQYHSEIISSGWHVRVSKTKSINVCCNYASVTGKTCLQPKNSKESYDTRGEDYNNCKLFVEGEQIRRSDIIGKNKNTSV